MWKGSNSLTLNLKGFFGGGFCGSRECFAQCGFVSGLSSALSLGTQSSHFSFPPLISPIISFPLFQPSVFLISRLPFPLDKWRNAGAYFLNLGWGEHLCDWQGSVLERLSGSLFASESCCWQPRLCLQYRAGKPKIKNNTGRFYWNEYFFSAHGVSFSLSSLSVFVSTAYLPVSYFFHDMFCVCLYLNVFLFPCLTFSLAWSHISCGWVYSTMSIIESWLRVMRWWRHDVSQSVSQKHPKIIQTMYLRNQKPAISGPL